MEVREPGLVRIDEFAVNDGGLHLQLAVASAMILSLSVQSNPRLVKTRTPLLSITIWQRHLSNFTSVNQSSPLGGLSTRHHRFDESKPFAHTHPREMIMHEATRARDE